MAGCNRFPASWSRQEDQILRQCRKMGMTYTEVSAWLTGRTPKACQHRALDLADIDKLFIGPDTDAAPEIVRHNAIVGSERLLQAQLITGQHFVQCPDLYRQRCMEVGL